jgi:hypothetical protein
MTTAAGSTAALAAPRPSSDRCALPLALHARTHASNDGAGEEREPRVVFDHARVFRVHRARVLHFG